MPVAVLVKVAGPKTVVYPVLAKKFDVAKLELAELPNFTVNDVLFAASPKEFTLKASDVIFPAGIP